MTTCHTYAKLTGMTFQPGHTINLGSHERRSAVNETKRMMRSLAMHIRERVDVEKLVERLEMMALGKDPTTGEALCAKDQREAIKLLLERGFGMPAMHVALEGEIRQEVQLLAPPKRTGAGLTLDQINDKRAKLRALGVVPRLIEATAIEHALPSGDESDDDDNEDE